MQYNTREEAGYRVLELSGEVDLHYSPQARKQILELLGQGHNLLVDLSSVEYIDSSGVASLVEGFQLSKNENLKFGLIGVSDAAMQVLQLARLDKVFPIHNAIADIK
jgi:anti-sigma B factor antagonist